MKKYMYNFKKYAFKSYYMQEHPDGKSYPPLLERLYIFWKLKNEPTFNEDLNKWRRLHP